MSFQPGRAYKLFYNSGTRALPTWVEISEVSDVSTPMSRNTSTTTTRASWNVKTSLGARVFSVTATYNQKTATDTVLSAIKASFFADEEADAVMDLAVMNKGMVSGSTGIRGYFAVTGFEHSQPVEGTATYNITWSELDYVDATDGLVDADEYTVA